MELSILDYTLSPKQSGFIATLQGLCESNGIKIYVDKPLPACSEPVSFDIEHDESGAFVLCGFYIPSDNSYYGFTSLNSLHSVPIGTLQLVGHNGLSDLEALRFWGCDVKDDQLVHDTMLVGHILNSALKTYGLKDMAKRELGVIYPSYEDIVGKRTTKQASPRITLDKQPQELVILYNAMDCFATGQLFLRQGNLPTRAKDSSQVRAPALAYFKDLEKPVAHVFAAMEDRGVRVDLAYLETLKASLEAQQAPIKASILNELGPINLNSPKQLLEALNGKGIYPNLKGKPSTDKRALAYVQCDVVWDLLKYSELDTLLSSFVYPYLERGQEYVHPFFNQVGTRTGRPSCSNPNLLQIPRRTENGKLVRRMFIPRDGMVMGDCDYGQIEPRVLAHLSKDPALCNLFNEGIDFHDYTAKRLGIDRDKAKILNLSVGYRATFKSVSQQLKCSDKEAQNEIDKWWGLFTTLRRWQDRLIYDSKTSGFCTTLLGRKIRVDDLAHGNAWRREGAERQLINNITQGSAAEIMKLAMIRIANNDHFYSTFGLLVQVYDELLWESAHWQHDFLQVIFDMENAIKLDVPLVVDCKTGSNWSDCH